MPVKRLLLALALSFASAPRPRAARGAPPEKFRQKLVILGFDGMDPKLVQKWMDEGKLPNMQKLAKRGSGVRPLTTTHSPESPTAWASFATGVNAGKHNIYDFLVRDTLVVPAGSRHGHARAAAVRPQLHSDLETEDHLDSGRDVVLGHGRQRRRPLQPADGAGHLPSGRSCRTARCSRASRCRTFAARWGPSTTSAPI